MTEIIPAIDIIDGKCVRLSQGDFGKKKEYGDPLDMALKFQDHGIRRLHLVDLDGARQKRVVNYSILEQIAGQTGLLIDVGGGIRSQEDLQIVFESGAEMATGGSIAVTNPELFLDWLDKWGPEKIILGADFRKDLIAVSGWQEDSGVDLLEFISGYHKKGIKMCICTDIDQDGMLKGPSRESYSRIMEEVKGLELIASGGVSSMKDIEQLDSDGLAGVIVGKAIYENRITLKELEKYIIDKN